MNPRQNSPIQSRGTSLCNARAPRFFAIPKDRLDALWAEPRLPRLTALLKVASAAARKTEYSAAAEQERKRLVVALVEPAPKHLTQRRAA